MSAAISLDKDLHWEVPSGLFHTLVDLLYERSESYASLDILRANYRLAKSIKFLGLEELGHNGLADLQHLLNEILRDAPELAQHWTEGFLPKFTGRVQELYSIVGRRLNRS